MENLQCLEKIKQAYLNYYVKCEFSLSVTQNKMCNVNLLCTSRIDDTDIARFDWIVLRRVVNCVIAI